MTDEPLDTNQFQGGVFSKELPNGRASAVITLELSYIRAKTTTGQEFTLRYSETNLEMGGSSGRMVFCRNADKSLTIFCEDKKFPAALELESSGDLREELERVLGNRKKEKWSGRFWFVTISAISIVLLIGLYIGVKLGAKAAVHALPYSVDEKIGELAHDQMKDGFPEARNQKVVDAIETIVRRLEKQSVLPNAKFTVRVVDAPIMNAYALPGGFITVYTGLIDESESAEEVAGVIAHEMAHVTLRHGMERIAGQIGIVIGVQLIFGDASGVVAMGAELGQYAAENSYSRSQETEADLEGARMLYDAGLDPLSVVPLFEDLKKLNNAGIPAWLSTHPDTQDRIDQLKDYAATLAPKQYDTFAEIDWLEIKRLAKGGEADAAEEVKEATEPAPVN